MRCTTTPPIAVVVPRSKRALHSTFWTHGAGDLDLPPSWATCHGPPPPPTSPSDQRPFKRDSASSSCSKRDHHRPGNGVYTPTEGAFLDFLYPPQALAWLQRASGQQWEKWERRNARRSPDGCVQASRGYASRSKAKAAGLAGAGGEEAQSTSDRGDNILVNEMEGYEDSASVELTGSTQEGLEDEHSAEVKYDKNDPFADSPADLADEPFAETVTDPLDGLRRLMKVHKLSRAAEGLSDGAWSLYESLDESDRQDVRLKNELITWFVAHQNPVADAHCISLFQSIPPEKRSHSTYEAVFLSCLTRMDVDQAIIIQKEALSNTSNAHQVSATLFKKAIEQNLWNLALRVERELCAAFNGSERDRQRELFWINVTEIPRLLFKASDLITHLTEHARTRLYNKKFSSFSKKLCIEAIMQHLHQQESRGVEIDIEAIPHLRTLYSHIDAMGNAPDKFYEESLMILLRLQSKTESASLFHLASSVYMQYRTIAGFSPPERLLMGMLERLVLYIGRVEMHLGTRASKTLRALFTDWKRYHGKLSVKAFHLVMSCYASIGDPAEVNRYLDILRSQYPQFADQRGALWTTIYVHARRMELSEAKAAFENVCKIAAENGEQPKLRWWNILLYAHSRVDDLEGALETFERLVKQTNLPVDVKSFHPIMTMLARRGDVESIEDFAQQYDQLCGEKRSTHFVGSLMIALVNNGDVPRAESVLKNALDLVYNGEIQGSLTGNFNILLTAYALRRDLASVMRIEQWMKSKGIRMNANSFGALIHVLCSVRRTNSAWKVLCSLVKDEGIAPTAFHYSLVMTGYINERQYDRALQVHWEMEMRNVRPTLSSRRAFLKAKLFSEHHGRIGGERSDTSVPLNEIISELGKILRASDGAELATKQPALGYDRDQRERMVGEYFESIIYVHGRRRCLEAVRELYDAYKQMSGTSGDKAEPPPMRILMGIMMAHWRLKDYAEVEELWKLAKERADQANQLTTIPDFRPSPEEVGDDNRPALKSNVSQNINADTGGAESGFAQSQHDLPDIKPPKSEDLPVAMRPRARRFILNRPLRIYLGALVEQSRTVEALSTVGQLLRQGYELDKATWNSFIVRLCNASPPLVLLAFTLTERFLIAQFSGWVASTRFVAYRRSTALKTEYMQSQYTNASANVPQYRTMVRLGAALLKLREMESTSGLASRRHPEEEINAYIGTVDQIQERAPNTVFAVESMPRVDDKWQHEIIGREE